LPYVLAAGGRHRSGPAGLAEAPQRNVHFVHALVANVAVAGVPEPEPVVGEFVRAERLLLRRTEEQIPVDSSRNRLVGCVADGEAAPETQRARVVDRADFTLPDQLDRLHL